MHLLLFSAVVFYSCFILIAGEGQVEVRFEYYSNPDGTLNNGHCCDGWPLRCQPDGGCDYYFRICLDEAGRPDNTKSCQYGYHRSNKVADNQKNVIFSELGASFGGLPNPVTFQVPVPIDGRNLTLKIDVKEDDRWTRGDYVDYFSQPIKFYKGIYPELHMPLELTSRTRLLTAVTIKCAKNWYGERCTKKCNRPGKNDNYRCDLWTGEKICLPGAGGTRRSANNDCS